MNETTNNEKLYELRDLSADDIFPIFTIISKIGIKEFKKCFAGDDVKDMIKGGNVDAEKIGLSIMIDMAGIIFAHAEDAKNDIFKFLSGLSGKSLQEIAELDMVVFAEMLIDVFKKDQFKDFIKVVSKLFK